MVNLKIAGKITRILPIQSGTSQRGNEWKKQEFILEYLSGNYPNSVAFTLFGERRIAENPIQVGQEVTVSFDIESREYGERWYTNCNAWRIEQGDTTTGQPNTNTAPQATNSAGFTSPGAPVAPDFSGGSDDLPF